MTSRIAVIRSRKLASGGPFPNRVSFGTLERPRVEGLKREEPVRAAPNVHTHHRHDCVVDLSGCYLFLAGLAAWLIAPRVAGK